MYFCLKTHFDILNMSNVDFFQINNYMQNYEKTLTKKGFACPDPRGCPDPCPDPYFESKY